MNRVPKEIQERLERFLRKYYSLKLLKGAILGVGLVCSYFLLLGFVELGFRVSSAARMTMFYSFIVLAIAVAVFYLAWPLFQILKIGRRFSYPQAASLIGAHFKNIDDKLLNLLQLGATQEGDNTLLAASIAQKSKELKVYSFTDAINVKPALKYWPILAVPLLVFVGLMVGNATEPFTEATTRLVKYNEEFKPAFPFTISMEKELEVERNSTYKLSATFAGTKVPNEMLLLTPSGPVRMVNQGGGMFSYTFNRVAQNQQLQFKYGDLQSDGYMLRVKDVPQLNDFIMEVIPPAYTGFTPSLEAVENVMSVPEGSDLRLIAKAQFVDDLQLQKEDTSLRFSREEENLALSMPALQNSLEYALIGNYQGKSKVLSPNNVVTVLKDGFPTIEASFEKDSLNPNRVYYRYKAGDDYGITATSLIVKSGKEQLGKRKVERLSGYGVVDLGEYIKNDNQVELYLVTSDNDGVNGSKSTRSKVYATSALSEESLKQSLRTQYSALGGEKDRLNERLKKQAEEYKEQANKMKAGEYKWKDRKALEELVKEQQKLLAEKKELEKKQEQLKKELQEEKPKEEDIRNKEKEEELQKLLDEIEELKDKLGMKELEKKLKKVQELSEQVQRQEARQDKLDERLEAERDLLRSIDKLEELAKKQEALAKKEGADAEKQKEIEEELARQKEQIEEAKSKVPGMEESMKEESMQEKTEQAEEDVEKATEGAKKDEEADFKEQDKPSKPSKSQETKKAQSKSSESLKEMAEGLMSALSQSQQQQEGEDAQMLRQILENVEELSHGTEEVLERTKVIERDDPQVKDLLLQLNKLTLGTKVVRDSLTALANRNPKVKQKVFEELDAISNNQEKSLDGLQNVELKRSAGTQQYVMLAANNLALMLDASLQQMMQQMAKSKPGNQNCQKPGGSKPNKAGMAKRQQELAEQMGKMKKGEKPGEQGEKGDSKGKGDQGMNGEIAKMISKQEQLRKAYEQMKENGELPGGNETGEKPTEELMEEVERDLYEKNITQETIDRVNEITSRLLKDERAKRKQEMDEQREAESTKERKQEGASELRFLREKSRVREELLYNDLILNPRLSQDD